MRNRTVRVLSALAVVVTTAALLAPATPALAGSKIKITAAYYDPSNGPDPDTNAGRNHEYILIRNGGSRAVKLTKWVLHDVPRAGTVNAFTFPKFTLRAGHTVRVHTGTGKNTSTDLYWGLTYYVWGDDSDTATLQNAAGTVISTCAWTTTDSSPKFC